MSFRHNILPSQPDNRHDSKLSPNAVAALANIGLSDNPADELFRYDHELMKQTEQFEWGQEETEEALAGWWGYSSKHINGVPESYNELAASHPNFEATINRLYNAKQQIAKKNFVTRAGEPVADNMHLVLIPWQQIRNHRVGYFEWVDDLYKEKERNTDTFSIGNGIWYAVETDRPIYRDPNQPETIINPTDYLDKKIESDGPWGIMLMQAGTYPIAVDGGQCPDDLTSDGKDHYTRTLPYPIDAMGLFEFGALTLQQNNPFNLGNLRTMLIANRYIDNSNPRPNIPLIPTIRSWPGNLGGYSMSYSAIRAGGTMKNNNVYFRLAIA